MQHSRRQSHGREEREGTGLKARPFSRGRVLVEGWG